MSHSTADNNDRTELRILFLNGDDKLATMRIAGPANYSEKTELTVDVPYIDINNSTNLSLISDEDEIDDISTIQIYVGRNPEISPILLLEDTTYEIDMELNSKIDSVFSFLNDNSGTISLRESYFGNEFNKIYTLRFIGYVGRGFFDITESGKTFRIPFEVRSRKLGYRTEYPQMLSDITEFSTSILLQMKSPLFRYYGISDKRSNSGYEDFLILDYIFEEMHLRDLIEFVKNHRHYNTERIHRTVPSGLAGDIDDFDMTSLISGNNLMPMDGGPICNAYAPKMIEEIVYSDNYDTPENRLVKDLLLTIRHMSGELRSGMDSDMSDYVRNRLDEIFAETDSMSSEQWLSELGELHMIPFESTVLQSAHGYSELFRAYQMLGLGAMFEQSDIEGLLKGHGSRISEVYEYWCYTRLYRCLYRLSSNKPEFPLSDRDGTLSITIKGENGIKFEIPDPEGNLIVKLYYNKGFSPKKKDFRSYSIGLRPDYTLVIGKESNEERIIINFDAKYKLKPIDLDDSEFEDIDETSECWKADLYKMHTYRDALMKSYGSYVLYPGETNRVYVKPRKESEWISRNNDVIPSIGSIQLIPGSDDEPELENLICKILNKIVGLIDDDENLDPKL